MLLTSARMRPPLKIYSFTGRLNVSFRFEEMLSLYVLILFVAVFYLFHKCFVSQYVFFSHRINKDWETRFSAGLGNYKRVERKMKPADNQIDNSNIWKSKQPLVPPILPHGAASGPPCRPEGQRRGVFTPAPNYKDKKGQDKSLNRLQLLMYLTQTQPLTMVWGKSWKYNKSLPSPEEGTAATSDWGKCWMFATQQPYSEAGKPWLNGPNKIDPHSLYLWKKPVRQVVDLDLSLPTQQWQMSWRTSGKNNKKGDTSSINCKNVPKSGFFTLLMESQHHNQALCSSDWSESWRSTKPVSQQDHFIIPNDSLMNESTANKQDKDREMSSKWGECWRLVNHHGCNIYNLPQVKKNHSPEWANSWRATNSSLRQDQSDTYDDHRYRYELHLHKVMYISHEQEHKNLYLQLCNEFKALSEWYKSWQVTKNNSKPCEEIEKVLKVSPPRMETVLEAETVRKNTKVHYSISEKADPLYEHLRHSMIYHSKRKLTQSNPLHLKHLENVLSASEWRHSWKTLKRRMRMERRMRPDPSRLFRVSEKGGDMKATATKWKDSWKFTQQPLSQEPELWQQGWSTLPQIRVDRARNQNHFAPIELPKNGPTGERSWGESWRFLRPQHRSEREQGRVQTSQGRPSVASHSLSDSLTHRSVRQASARSVSDWQDAWMVSETQFHHDKPSFTQWREAWKWSVFNKEHWTEQLSRKNWLDVLMEIQPQREKISLQRAKSKISRSFDNQMFGERYPEKQWSASWRAGPLLWCEQSMTSTNQRQHATTTGHGSKWEMSFRLANPMPDMEEPWVESSLNPCHNTVIWSRKKNIQNNINTSFSNNPFTFRHWEKSHWFLQGGSTQIKDITKSKEPFDPEVIITKKSKTKRHLYSKIESNKQERKWTGCHLLGKTQPRPKKGPALFKNLMTDHEKKFFEDWAQSWRLLVWSGSLKKQMLFKLLLGWDESWKFLLPPYQPMNGPKTK